MEVKDFTKQFLKTLKIDDVNELSNALMNCLKNEKELRKLLKAYDKLLKKADDPNIDDLQGTIITSLTADEYLVSIKEITQK